ncbi:hypothetical protein HAX54_020669 [Datura stramonium]|uniref:Uncharacterized protein n=1 Tax=Datura stramonium TaxID=4076 RepID=A0ABS8URN5_DATST|nr:hypothetical protein [Datura stramonium]
MLLYLVHLHCDIIDSVLGIQFWCSPLTYAVLNQEVVCHVENFMEKFPDEILLSIQLRSSYSVQPRKLEWIYMNYWTSPPKEVVGSTTMMLLLWWYLSKEEFGSRLGNTSEFFTVGCILQRSIPCIVMLQF